MGLAHINSLFYYGRFLSIRDRETCNIHLRIRSLTRYMFGGEAFRLMDTMVLTSEVCNLEKAHQSNPGFGARTFPYFASNISRKWTVISSRLLWSSNEIMMERIIPTLVHVINSLSKHKITLLNFINQTRYVKNS